MTTTRTKFRRHRQAVRCADEKLCLAFVNTVAWRDSGHPEERLGSLATLVDWCAANGMDAGSMKRLAEWFELAPGEASSFHGRAIELREAIYGLLRSGIKGEAADDADLVSLNEVLADLPARQALAPTGEGLGWQAAPRLGIACEILAPIVWSASDLLSGPRIDRVKQCEDSRGCAWLFLDESRGGTRRWCSMGDCGNRAKARRHYLRAAPKHPAEAEKSGS